MKNRIIVGYDGSPSSAAAVDWAAREAAARRARLTLLTCHPTRPAVAVAEAMAEELRRRDPQLSCEAEGRAGSPKGALVDASSDADLMVVGKTGAGAAKTLLVGSVANAVIRHSHAPVVLVPRSVAPRPRSGVIVVGVDGSPAADAALDWAIAEGSIHGGELRIVLAWSFAYSGPAIESTEAHGASCADARGTLDRIVECANRRATGFAVSGLLVEDSPAVALCDAAVAADLLVVGSRGHGALRSVLIGSVADAVTERAACPTAVIHHKVRA